MVNIKRSKPTKSIIDFLSHQKTLSEGKYENDEIGKLLIADFHTKCYLCELKTIGYNVEHFRPHQDKNKDLKFDWYNLYFSCERCNNIKGKFYNDTPNNAILDCCDSEHDVSNWIKYEIKKENLITRVEITAIDNQPITEKTVELLLKIYNGTTDHKKNEAETLKKKILKQMQTFQKILTNYLETKDEEDFEEIKRLIKTDSKFCAFKRWIIKSKSAYKIFESHF